MRTPRKHKGNIEIVIANRALKEKLEITNVVLLCLGISAYTLTAHPLSLPRPLFVARVVVSVDFCCTRIKQLKLSIQQQH